MNIEKNFLKIFSAIKKKNIPLELHEPYIDKNDILNVSKAVKTKNVAGKGDYTKKFEKKISILTKSKYVISCSSGTSALHLALKYLKINSNDEVLVPAINFISTANAIIYCGGSPHFIDVSEKTLGVDATKLSDYLNKIGIIKQGKLINKKTGKTIRAIIPMHTFGHPCEMDKIIKLAKKFRLECVEDAAEGVGSYYKNKHVGTFGIMGILSFNGNKTITAGGGGAILTNKKNIEKKIRNLTDHSKISHMWKYDYYDVGYNYRMPNLNAALGCSQIDKLNFIIQKHKKIYEIYKKKFRNINYGRIFKEPPSSRSNYWLQTFVLEKNNYKLRNKILNSTNKNGIHTRPAWKLMSEIKHLKKFPKMNLSMSEKLINRIINLPSSFNF